MNRNGIRASAFIPSWMTRLGVQPKAFSFDMNSGPYTEFGVLRTFLVFPDIFLHFDMIITTGASLHRGF